MLRRVGFKYYFYGEISLIWFLLYFNPIFFQIWPSSQWSLSLFCLHHPEGSYPLCYRRLFHGKPNFPLIFLIFQFQKEMKPLLATILLVEITFLIFWILILLFFVSYRGWQFNVAHKAHQIYGLQAIFPLIFFSKGNASERRSDRSHQRQWESFPAEECCCRCPQRSRK